MYDEIFFKKVDLGECRSKSDSSDERTAMNLKEDEVSNPPAVKIYVGRNNNVGASKRKLWLGNASQAPNWTTKEHAGKVNYRMRNGGRGCVVRYGFSVQSVTERLQGGACVA